MPRADSGYPHNFMVNSWVFKDDESKSDAKTNSRYRVCPLLLEVRSWHGEYMHRVRSWHIVYTHTHTHTHTQYVFSTSFIIFCSMFPVVTKVATQKYTLLTHLKFFHH